MTLATKRARIRARNRLSWVPWAIAIAIASSLLLLLRRF